MQLTHSLIAPGFNPWSLKSDILISKFAFKFNLYHYTTSNATLAFSDRPAADHNAPPPPATPAPAPHRTFAPPHAHQTLHTTVEALSRISWGCKAGQDACLRTGILPLLVELLRRSAAPVLARAIVQSGAVPAVATSGVTFDHPALLTRQQPPSLATSMSAAAAAEPGRMTAVLNSSFLPGVTFVNLGPEVGLYKLNSVVTHSLKAPGFNPCTCNVKTRLQSLLSIIQLVPHYTKGVDPIAKEAARTVGSICGCGENTAVSAEIRAVRRACVDGRALSFAHNRPRV
jgi:hypothetical protein